jgi:hypothetical protein
MLLDATLTLEVELFRLLNESDTFNVLVMAAALRNDV